MTSWMNRNFPSSSRIFLQLVICLFCFLERPRPQTWFVIFHLLTHAVPRDLDLRDLIMGREFHVGVVVWWLFPPHIGVFGQFLFGLKHFCFVLSKRFLELGRILLLFCFAVAFLFLPFRFFPFSFLFPSVPFFISSPFQPSSFLFFSLLLFLSFPFCQTQ